ncbi:hypothetical protein NT05LI_1073 [Listeria ivanovii FSL F6-596]|nr:hypothetical protein NT05LI_1073 [Listeria ivanovii FSL F6-596]
MSEKVISFNKQILRISPAITSKKIDSALLQAVCYTKMNGNFY